MSIDKVTKRDGKVVPFDRGRIERAIYAAARAVGNGGGRPWAETMSWAVTGLLEERFGQNGRPPHVEEIQDIVEEVLIKSGHPQVAKAYILYRQKRAEARATQRMLMDTEKLVDDYLQRLDWRVNENSNMNYSLQGLNFYLASSIAARYWLHKIYPREVQAAHSEGDMHIHDLGMLSGYTYYGQEVVLFKDQAGIRLTSFEQLYADCPEPEVTLNAADGAFARYPKDGFVLDRDGWTRVTRLVRKRKDRPMRFLKNRGGRSVIVTDNHPMITREGETPAASVRLHTDSLYTVNVRRLLRGEPLPSEAALSSFAWLDDTPAGWQAVSSNEPTDIPDDQIYDITTESGTLIVNGMWNHNCAGWDLQDLLIQGFGGVPAKVESRPPKHLRTALGQLVNFFYTLQGEVAGAVAVSNFDTLLAPFIRYDRLDYTGIKQAVQEFVYNINVPTRVGFQTPFTNITMDLTAPSTLRDQPVIISGKSREATYGEFQEEMDLLNRAFAEVMIEGDAHARAFTFPIPTYNVTRDFDWANPVLEPVWTMTAKYGLPYFGNYINSDMNPEDTRSMCCRLRLDNRELRKRAGGLFAAAPLTGSAGVVTINMPRLAYQSRDEADFQERLERLMEVARTSLEIKRKMLELLTERGLYPYSRHYLRSVKAQTGAYWSHHFSTIGLIGMNEACLNLLGVGIAHPEGQAFAIRTLSFMREVLTRFQIETGNLYNLEATPAEGASYRLARADKKGFPDIITAGTEETPFYTNSTHLPVSYSDDLFAVLDHQDELQTLYTGGTVLHIFLGERLNDWKQARKLVRTVAENYRLPYFTITPTFSICPVHGYIAGEHKYCPYEHTPEQLERYGVEVLGEQ